jgi:hypothetical protein
MKIFVTGGARNGTTLLMQLVVALGFPNAAMSLDIENFEDLELTAVVNEIMTHPVLMSMEEKQAKFDNYFQHVFEKFSSPSLSLKYPLLLGVPTPSNSVGSNPMIMGDMHLYSEFAQSILDNFDIILFVHRDPRSAALSELKYHLGAKENIDDIVRNQFVNEYSIVQEKTLDILIETGRLQNSNCKIVRFSYDSLLSDTANSILQLSSLLKSKSNSLLLHWLKDFVSTNGENRQPSYILSAISTFFGVLNKSVGSFDEENQSREVIIKDLKILINSLERHLRI